jgi:hypothetical protein
MKDVAIPLSGLLSKIIHRDRDWGGLLDMPKIQSIKDCAVLNNQVKMPWLGFGVFLMKDGAETENAVQASLAAGYRTSIRPGFTGMRPALPGRLLIVAYHARRSSSPPSYGTLTRDTNPR